MYRKFGDIRPLNTRVISEKPMGLHQTPVPVRVRQKVNLNIPKTYHYCINF